MAGRIPQQFIDDLLARTDIVEIIDSRVSLKKAGREYVACCPFHNEKTPSFTVSPVKQFYHCFGCGAHGSAVGFLMEYERMEFVDAIEELASKAGVSVPKEAFDATLKVQQDVYALLEQAAKFYRMQLKDAPQAKHAIEYLKSRGLTGEIANTYGVGFAAPGWDNLINYFTRMGQSAGALANAGLVIKKDSGGFYDRFRNRIIFPIHDRRGRVIGFGGRALGDEQPKYLNSPENSLFHKGHELYGLYQARKAVRNLESLIVVEGYMDVVSLAQFGIHNVVATLGTATTMEHMERLFRLVEEVVFCFDGDRAGRKAAWKALTLSLPILKDGRQIKFLFLPDGEDPDSMVRKEGKPAFERRLQNASPFSEFFFEGLTAKLDLSSIDSRALLVERAKPLLTKMPGGVFQQMVLVKLAEIAGMDSEKLSTLILSNTVPKQKAPQQRIERPLSTVRYAIRMLLEFPRLAQVMDIVEVRKLQLPGIPLLCRLAEICLENPQITCGALMEYFRGTEEGGYLAKLVNRPLNLSDEGINKEFQDTVNLLFNKRLEQRIDELLAKPLDQLSDAEKQELQQAFTTKH